MKTNGGKVREMTNDELVEWGLRYFFSKKPQSEYATVVRDMVLFMLNEPAEQTADEMFAELGFDIRSSNDYSITYYDGLNSITVHKELVAYSIPGEMDFLSISDLEKISQKKREEMGWTECTK